ncbi:MAG: threonine aldolase family protein [Oscillospiraceae bacterium]|jgi:threonine aldolase
MLHFDCDYMEGTHPRVLKRLEETNLEQTPGYGYDSYTASAKERIRRACGCPGAGVEFLIGGTQVNAVMIKSLLDVTEGAVCADTGHIGVHEAGAIEFTGHKVITLPSSDGKISAEQLSSYLDGFYSDPTYPHMVQPGMVYVTHPTELGTTYSRKELEDISSVCRSRSLRLYLDGARLGYGLAAYGSDLTLPDIARLCDAFYIGGTKVGALFGEAVVVPDPGIIKNFFTSIKQSGALLAKGRILGIQFDELFTDGLYFEISRHAVDMAMKLRAGFKKRGYEFFIDSPTNQQFLLLADEQEKKISEIATFDVWGRAPSGKTISRFATSWATRESDVDALIAGI